MTFRNITLESGLKVFVLATKGYLIHHEVCLSRNSNSMIIWYQGGKWAKLSTSAKCFRLANGFTEQIVDVNKMKFSWEVWLCRKMPHKTFKRWNQNITIWYSRWYDWESWNFCIHQNREERRYLLSYLHQNNIDQTGWIMGNLRLATKNPRESNSMS